MIFNNLNLGNLNFWHYSIFFLFGVFFTFHNFEMAFYWVMPLIAICMFYVLIYVDKIKINFSASILYLSLGIVFLLSAFFSGAELYPSRRSIYFFMMVLLLISINHLLNSKYKVVLIDSLLLIVLFESIYGYFRYFYFDGGISDLLETKNEWGVTIYLLAVLATIKYLSSQNPIYAFIFLLAIIMYSNSLSAKFLAPLALLSLFVFFNMQAISRIITAFLIGGFIIFIVIFFPDVVESSVRAINIIFSKNLAIFSDEQIIGSGTVERRLSLIGESIRTYTEGNMLLGGGLEIERNYLGTYSHNSFVSTLVGGGLLGIFFLFLIFLSMVYKILRFKFFSKNMLFYSALFVSLIFIIQGTRYYDIAEILFIFSLLTVQLPLRLYTNSYK